MAARWSKVTLSLPGAEVEEDLERAVETSAEVQVGQGLAETSVSVTFVVVEEVMVVAFHS